MSLSPHVGELSNLTHLELIGNYLETLPPELEGCQSLKRSCLIVEENLLNTLPPPVTERLQTCLDKCWPKEKTSKSVPQGFKWELKFPNL